MYTMSSEDGWTTFGAGDKVAAKLGIADVARLFEGLTEMKKDRLPNLKTIRFDLAYDNAHDSSDPHNKKIRVACKSAGIALQVPTLYERQWRGHNVYEYHAKSDLWLTYAAIMAGELLE